MTPTAAGAAIKAVFHFADGSLRITFTEADTFTPDMMACTATLDGTGSYVVTGGTGRYRHATGKGTFTTKGLIVGARDATGACLAGNDSTVPPLISSARVDAKGTLTLHQ